MRYIDKYFINKWAIVLADILNLSVLFHRYTNCSVLESKEDHLLLVPLSILISFELVHFLYLNCFAGSNGRS